MGGSNYRYTREHEQWVLDNLDKYPTQRAGRYGRALFAAFRLQFPDLIINDNQLRMFCQRVASGQRIPESPTPDFTEQVLDLKCKAALVTSDHHVPHHDADLISFALELGREWGCDLHLLNGDVYDAGAASKFPPLLYGERVPMSEELKMGRQILEEMSRGFDRTVYILGSNHEARWFANFFQGQLDADDMARLVSLEHIAITPLGYCYVNGKRVTHPGSASVVPVGVGNDLAANFYCDVISGHGHSIGYRRDRGGRYTVVDTGGLFDARRIAYLQQRDRRRPLTNQGFCIIDGDEVYLFDPRNLNRELWLEFAKTRRLANEKAS